MEFLSIKILTTLVAFGLIFLHLTHPHLAVDNVTVFLACLGFVPWLAPIIKSVEVSGIGKIELNDLKRKVDEAQSAAMSADRKAQFAVAASLAPPEVTDNCNKTTNEKLDFLCDKYNRVRATMPSGAARTVAMTNVIRSMIDVFKEFVGFDAKEALKEADAGKRLAGYAYTYSKPEFELLVPVTETLTKIEDKPFGQYWAIQAIGQILANRGEAKVPYDVTESLTHFLQTKLKPGIDRYYELSKILESIA